MYRRLDDLEITLRSRESYITELQNDIGTYKKELNEAETKVQQELSRSQTLEQELQVRRDKVSEVLEECQRKTDDFLHLQNEYAEVCMVCADTALCVRIFCCIYTCIDYSTFMLTFLHALVVS
jgi:chromosome segregation ATPase